LTVRRGESRDVPFFTAPAWTSHCRCGKIGTSDTHWKFSGKKETAMFTPSDKCPRRDACVQNGKGLIHMKDLTDKEGLYNHGRLFAHVTIDPGCSIGDHPHNHETEFYYIIKGEGVFNDNGTEVVVRPGDICATGYGEVHGLENRGTEPVELIALIVGE